MKESPAFAFQIAPVSDDGDASDASMYATALEDARLGHSLGLSTGWIIEHHFTDYYPTPNPLMMLSHVAAACPGLGLGTSVMVLPWYHPLRFAEDIAMLQTMATGDLHIGIGRGTAKLEYDAFQVDMTEARERFEESWAIVRTALEGQSFKYSGRTPTGDASRGRSHQPFQAVSGDSIPMEDTLTQDTDIYNRRSVRLVTVPSRLGPSELRH